MVGQPPRHHHNRGDRTTTLPDDYERRFALGRVIDGDTIVAGDVDLGYHATITSIEYRLLRINCPESNKKATMAAGLAAKVFTTAWLAEHVTHGGTLYATTQRTDSFGRYLAEITCGTGHNLSDALLASGHAVPYPPTTTSALTCGVGDL